MAAERPRTPRGRPEIASLSAGLSDRELHELKRRAAAHQSTKLINCDQALTLMRLGMSWAIGLADEVIQLRGQVRHPQSTLFPEPR